MQRAVPFFTIFLISCFGFILSALVIGALELQFFLDQFFISVEFQNILGALDPEIAGERCLSFICLQAFYEGNNFFGVPPDFLYPLAVLLRSANTLAQGAHGQHAPELLVNG